MFRKRLISSSELFLPTLVLLGSLLDGRLTTIWRLNIDKGQDDSRRFDPGNK
jgi:hypothetical protein